MSISNLNLKNDLASIIKQYFKLLENFIPNLHFHDQIKDISDLNKLCLAYYNLTNRLIEPRSREVHKSSIFYCPSKFRTALEIIEEKIENGEDINPYLSKGIRWVVDMHPKRTRNRDALLDSWGIKHIHLGSQIESNGFAERSGPILFVKFDDENAYFLLIKRHGSKSNRRHDPWNNQFLIDILHKNWSESINDYEAKVEVIKATDDEIKQWKKGNVNVAATTKNGTIYFPPGGGVASSGDNIQNVRICYHIFGVIDANEKWLRDNFTEFIETLKRNGKNIKKPLDFQLVSFEFIGINLKIEVLEKNSQVYIVFEERKQPMLSFEID